MHFWFEFGACEKMPKRDILPPKSKFLMEEIPLIEFKQLEFNISRRQIHATIHEQLCKAVSPC